MPNRSRAMYLHQGTPQPCTTSAPGIDDEEAIKQRPLELVKASRAFPLSADFRKAEAKERPNNTTSASL